MTELERLFEEVPEYEELVDIAVDQTERSVGAAGVRLWEWFGLETTPPTWNEGERSRARLLVACACAPLDEQVVGWLGPRLLKLSADRWAALLMADLRQADEDLWRRVLAERYESVWRRCAPRGRWRTRELADLLASDDADGGGDAAPAGPVAGQRRRDRAAAGGGRGGVRGDEDPGPAGVTRRKPRCRLRHRGREARPHGGLGAVAPARESDAVNQPGAATGRPTREEGRHEPTDWWLRLVLASGLMLGALVLQSVPAEAAPIGPTTVLAGLSSQGYPSFFEISGNGRTLKLGAIAMNMTCSSGDQFVVPDRDVRIPITHGRQAPRGLRAGADPVLGRRVRGGTDTLNASSIPQHTKLTGTWRLEQTYISPSGQTDQCDSGPVQFTDVG